MALPTESELAKLREAEGDAEKYHSFFDDILEERLDELDPEWMRKMREVYDKSRMARWCA